MKEPVEILYDRLIAIYIGENGQCSENFKTKVADALSCFSINGKSEALAEYTGNSTKAAINAFKLEKIAAGMSANTVYAYEKHLNRIFNTIEKHYNEVRPFDIRAYLAKRRLDGISQSMLRNEFSYLSSFYSFLSKEGVCENIMDKVERPKKPDIHKDAFSDRDIEMIRLACRDLRQQAVIEVLISTGCRISELCNIKLTDIDGNKIKVTGKGNKTRFVYLNARAQLAMENYLKGRKYESVWLFYPKGKPNVCMNENSLRHCIEDTGKRAGVAPCNPHRFRHYYATHMNKVGMDISVLCKSMGHANISTTQIYVDVTDDMVERAHGQYA